MGGSHARGLVQSSANVSGARRPGEGFFCFEQLLVQQPDDREVCERVRDLQAVIEGEARGRYEELKLAIAVEHARLGAAAPVMIFNQPALLGLEPGRSGEDQNAHSLP